MPKKNWSGYRSDPGITVYANIYIYTRYMTVLCQNHKYIIQDHTHVFIQSYVHA